MLSGQTWSILEHAFANGSLWWEKTNVFTPNASLIVPEPPSPMVHHIETVDAWNLKPSRIQLGVLSRHTGCNAVSIQEKGIKKQHKHSPVPMQFLPNAPYNAANTSTRDTHKLWDPKNAPQIEPMWLIAFAGELGDVVSRPLPHGILDTPEDTQAGDFPPQKSELICAWTFLYLSKSVGESGFFGAYQPNPPKM